MQWYRDLFVQEKDVLSLNNEHVAAFRLMGEYSEHFYLPGTLPHACAAYFKYGPLHVVTQTNTFFIHSIFHGYKP